MHGHNSYIIVADLQCSQSTFPDTSYSLFLIYGSCAYPITDAIRWSSILNVY